MTGYHRLPPSLLASLRGGGDRAERDLFAAANVSKGLARLRAVLDELQGIESVDGHTVDDIGLTDSFRTLADAQRRDPRAVARLLGGPQVGAWAATCLRRLAPDAPAEPAVPRWVHLAHLGSIAAAAALRVGLRRRVIVPVSAGAVHLPALGRALVTDATEPALAECVTEPAGVVVGGAVNVTWEPVRQLTAHAGGVTLSVHLDDIDPYWSVFGLHTTARLPEDELDDWRERLREAWAVLAARHAHRLDTMAGAIRCLVPVRQEGRLGGVSASSADAPGAVALTRPTSPLRLAATLVHESQHFRLSTLHDLRRLHTPADRLLYSPWRNDPRPLSGVVHGLMAFAGVADFWSRERTDPASELEYARHARQVRLAHRVASGDPALTRLGAAVVATLGEAAAALPLDTGPPAIRRLADDLVAEHHARWRLRTVTPDEDAVQEFCRAWRQGRLPAGVAPSTGRPTPRPAGGDNPMTRIAMAWVRDEHEVRALTEDAEVFAKRFPGAVPGDVPLVAGDYGAARAEALAEITAGAAGDRAWAALAVTHRRACPGSTRSPLAGAPELVRAAFTRVSPEHDTGPLLALMARYEAGTSTSDTMRR